MKKRLAFVLVFALCAALLCIGAGAAEGCNYNIWVGGTQVTSANAYDVFGDGTVRYNAEKNTLTLNNANITYSSTENIPGAIYANDDLTILLVGTNSVTDGNSGNRTQSAGVYVTGDLTFSGSGSLTAEGGDISTGDSNAYSYGVYADGELSVSGGSVTGIGGNITSSGGNQGEEHLEQILLMSSNGVSASASDEWNYSYGIYSAAGITVSSGSVTGIGGSITSSGGNIESCGLVADGSNLTVTGGKITASGGDVEGNDGAYSDGLAVDNEIIVHANGTIFAKGGSAVGDIADSDGIWVAKGLTNYGTISAAGNVATSTTGSANSYGIRCNGSISNFGSGSMTANGGAAEGGSASSYGIYAKNDMELSGATVTATADTATAGVTENVIDSEAVSAGISVNSGELTISSGTVTATAGVATAMATNDSSDATATAKSCGVYVGSTSTSASDSITVTGGVVNATGGNVHATAKIDSKIYESAYANAYAYSYGVCAKSGAITASGNGQVTATGGDSQRDTESQKSHSDSQTYGVYANGSITVKGNAEVSGTGRSSDSVSYGVYTPSGRLGVHDSGTLTGISGEALNSSFGIRVGSGTGSSGESVMLIIDGSATVTGIANTASTSCGVSCTNIVADGNAALFAKGGSGLSINLTVKGNATVYAEATFSNQAAISSSVTIEGGHVTARGVNQVLGGDPTGLEGIGYLWRTEENGQFTNSAYDHYVRQDTYIELIPGDAKLAESVRLSGDTQLYNGESEQLTAAVEPDGYVLGLVWTSSDPSVASVDGNGTVTAVSVGEAVITVRAVGNGKIAASLTVTVSDRPSTASGSVPDPTYKPVIDAPEDVEVTTDPARPKPGDEVTIKTEPDGTITVTDKDGNPVDVTRNPDGTWTYIQPEGAVKITVTPGVPELPFTDVPSGAWYYDAVSYVYFNGLMDGVSDTLFNPDGNMTRAMVWAILARMDGETVTGANWIDTARAWAMSEGVSDGTDPTGLVTREQLATMLWRYAGEPASEYSLSAYTDASSVSAWALDAMAWAVENGIVTGVTATTLDPQGTATRAQCAAILMRYIANI